MIDSPIFSPLLEEEANVLDYDCYATREGVSTFGGAEVGEFPPGNTVAGGGPRSDVIG